MNRELAALLATGPLTAEAIDGFIAGRDFPLVDASGVHFVYRGEADAVLLRHWVFGLPSSQPLERVDGTDLWHLFLELPQASRIEYKLDVVSGDDNRWITDPLNPLTAEDPFGRNSVCRGFGYRRPAWTLPDPATRPGTIDSIDIESRHLGDKREVLVYRPARYRKTRRYPLLVVHDGGDFLRYADLKDVLDNLIERLEIPPMIVALTHSDDRLTEYAADRRHGAFIAEELLPCLQGKLLLEDGPANRALMGASFGAVASLATAWRHPGVFGKLLLLSGSFGFTDIGPHHRGPAFDPVVEFMNEFRQTPGRPSGRIFLACGIYESLIYENRSIVPLLQAHDMEVRFREVPDGHNWENWRDRLRGGLSWLFPGPLWMIYE